MLYDRYKRNVNQLKEFYVLCTHYLILNRFSLAEIFN